MLEETDVCGATHLNHDHDKNSDHHHAWEDFVLTEPLVMEDPTVDVCENPIENSGAVSIGISRYEGSPQKSLLSKWTYYYHLPNDKTWDLASYKTIMSGIDSLDKLIAINEHVTDNIIKNCMLFVMRDRITPMWEDSCNRNGGCFSYKVPNKVVVQVWRDLTYLMCGNALTVDPKHMEYVNGITISPKRGFCIVKIWLKNCQLQDPNMVVNVENLTKAGCLFKNHKAEF
jgi:Eukaryotic initiation factor 4E